MLKIFSFSSFGQQKHIHFSGMMIDNLCGLSHICVCVMIHHQTQCVCVCVCVCLCVCLCSPTDKDTAGEGDIR